MWTEWMAAAVVGLVVMARLVLHRFDRPSARRMSIDGDGFGDSREAERG